MVFEIIPPEIKLSIPTTVDCRYELLIYPRVPRPCSDEYILAELTYEYVPRPIIVEVISKFIVPTDTYMRPNPCIVDVSCDVLTYPIDPRPFRDDVIFVVEI